MSYYDPTDLMYTRSMNQGKHAANSDPKFDAALRKLAHNYGLRLGDVDLRGGYTDERGYRQASKQEFDWLHNVASYNFQKKKNYDFGGDVSYDPWSNPDDLNEARAKYYKTTGKVPAATDDWKPLKYKVSEGVQSNLQQWETGLNALQQRGQLTPENVQALWDSLGYLNQLTGYAEDQERKRTVAEQKRQDAIAKGEYIPGEFDLLTEKKEEADKFDYALLRQLGYDDKTGFQKLYDQALQAAKKQTSIYGREDPDSGLRMTPRAERIYSTLPVEQRQAISQQTARDVYWQGERQTEARQRAQAEQAALMKKYNEIYQQKLDAVTSGKYAAEDKAGLPLVGLKRVVNTLAGKESILTADEKKELQDSALREALGISADAIRGYQPGIDDSDTINYMQYADKDERSAAQLYNKIAEGKASDAEKSKYIKAMTSIAEKARPEYVLKYGHDLPNPADLASWYSVSTLTNNPIMAGVRSFGSEMSVGLGDLYYRTKTPDVYEGMQRSAAQHPTATQVGSLAGLAVPVGVAGKGIGATGKLLTKALPALKNVSPYVTSFAQGSLSLGSTQFVTDINKGASLEDAAGNLLTNMALGGFGEVGFKMFGNYLSNFVPKQGTWIFNKFMQGGAPLDASMKEWIASAAEKLGPAFAKEVEAGVRNKTLYVDPYGNVRPTAETPLQLQAGPRGPQAFAGKELPQYTRTATGEIVPAAQTRLLSANEYGGMYGAQPVPRAAAAPTAARTGAAAPPVTATGRVAAGAAGDMTTTGRLGAAAETKPGMLPKGEMPRREIDVPAATEAGPTRQYARTMAEAPGISEGLAKNIVKDVEAGKYAREVVSDKAAIGRAASRIQEKGYAGALDDWNAKVQSGKRLDKYDIAQGDLLLQMADKAGDGATAQRIAVDLASEMTEAGRSLQAARLLKQLTPEGDLIRAQRAIDKLNSKFEKQIADGKMKKVELSDRDALDIMAATDKADRDKVLADIAKRVNSELPSTWGERIEAWRYTAMLTNPVTHAKNFLSNVMFYPMRKFSDLLAIPIERASGAVGKLAGKEVPQTKAILNPFKDKPLLDMGEESFKSIGKQLRGTKEDFGGTMAEGRKVFTSKAFAWLEELRKFNSKALDAEDLIFLRGEYKSSYAQYMKANKLTPEFLKSGTVEAKAALAKLEQHASRRALEATFRNESAFANMLARWERTNAATRVVIGGKLPFKRTPINLLKTGVAYSPGGLLKSLTVDFARLKAGKINATQLIENVTKGMTGTLMMGGGAWLASMGLIQGRIKKTGKSEDYWKDLGNWEYVLVVGDKQYSLEWIQPAILPIIMGVELYESSKSKNFENTLPHLLDAMLSITDPMFNTTMLQSVNSMIQGNYADDAASAALKALVDLGADYVNQFVPSLFGQIGREIAGEKKSYYVGGETPTMRALEQTIRGPAARLGIGEPSLDMWGQPKKNIPGAQFSPARISAIRDTAVDKEVLRLYNATADSKVLPGYAYKSFDYEDKTYRLTAEEYTKAQRTQGQYAYTELQKLFRSSEYKKLDDEKKRKAVIKIFDTARELAKTNFLRSRGIKYPPDKKK